jgi:hypothetical protein
VEDGTLDALEILVAMAIKIPTGLMLLTWDEKRLARRAPDQLARAWPPATRLSAMVLFPEIALILHFWRTRRSAVGVLVGVLWSVGFVLGTGLPVAAIDALLRPE